MTDIPYFVARALLAVLLVGTTCSAAFGSSVASTQEHYRWRKDDGDENGATWQAAVDAPVSNITRGTNLRVRLCLSFSGDAGASDQAVHRLQYSDGAAGPWTDVPASGALHPFVMAASQHYTNQTITSDQLAGTGVFQAVGRMVEAPDNHTTNLTQTAGRYINDEYCLRATAKAAGNGTYYLRSHDSNIAGDNVYSQLAQLTMEAGEADEPPAIVGPFATTGELAVSFPPYTVRATGSEPIAYNAAGLPPGLSFDGTRSITGTPAELGVFDVTLTAESAYGSNTQALSIVIVEPVALRVSTDFVLQGDRTGGLLVTGSGITIDGNGHALISPGPFSLENGIRVNGQSDITIRNFSGIDGNYAGILLEDCTNVHIENCSFTTNAFAGIVSRGGAESITVTGNTFRQWTHGIAIENQAARQVSLVIQSNRFLMGREAIRVQYRNGTNWTATVRGNRFEHQVRPALMELSRGTRACRTGEVVNVGLSLRHFDGSPGSNITCSMSVVPTGSVCFVQDGAAVTGTVQFSHQGLHSIVVRLEDPDGNTEKRLMRFQVGPTAERSETYYLVAREHLAFGPLAWKGVDQADIGSLSPKQPATIGESSCLTWIQHSVNAAPRVPVARLTHVDLNTLYKFEGPGSASMGIQRDTQFGTGMDEYVDIPASMASETHRWGEFTVGPFDWALDYTWEWWMLSVKFMAYQKPRWRTGDADHPSHAIFRCQVATSPEVKSLSNPQILLLGAILDSYGDARLVIEGEGGSAVALTGLQTGAVYIVSINGVKHAELETDPEGNLEFAFPEGGAADGTALAVSVDANRDNLPDSWQARYFAHRNAPEAAPDADPDGDGMDNRSEWRAGTRPNDSTSVFAVESLQDSAGNGFVIRWRSVAGRRYNIMCTTDLRVGFTQALANAIDATPSTNVYTTAPPASAVSFYRITTGE